MKIKMAAGIGAICLMVMGTGAVLSAPPAAEQDKPIQSTSENLQSSKAAIEQPPEKKADQDVRNVKLILPWNKEIYAVPAPAIIPNEMRQTLEYKIWKRVGDVRTFSWTAPDGRKYIAEALGFLEDENGRSMPLIPNVKLYRPDGTLEVETINSPEGEPMEWFIYAADGKTKQVKIHNRLEGSPGTPFIEHVDFLNPDGTNRQYRANQHGVVIYEWLIKEKQPTLLNGGNQYNDITPEDLK